MVFMDGWSLGPHDNNVCEQALKKANPYRKNGPGGAASSV